MTMLKRKKAYKFIIDIFLPNRCAFCQRVIRWDKLICNKCVDDMPLLGDEPVKVADEKAYSVFRYEGRVKKLINELKHTGEVDNFAEYCAELLCSGLRQDKADSEIDLVTAVPMHTAKKLKRGYDQAERLALYVADILGCKTDFKLLERSSDRVEQHKLTKTERQEHAEMIYTSRENSGDIKGRTVLICDDIITTGATMRVCAECLLNMGAKKVICCSAAATLLGDD